MVTLTEDARRPQVLFFNYIEAALAQKYNGIRPYDDGDCETCPLHRDRAEFVGEKQVGRGR